MSKSYIKIDDKYHSLDPVELYADLAANGYPTNFWGRANSIVCPIGYQPGFAYILMSRDDFDSMERDAEHEIHWYHSGNQQGKTVFKNYTVVNAESVVPGSTSSPYFVTFGDKRWAYANRDQVHSTETFSVNVDRLSRTGATVASTDKCLWAQSLNGGSEYTWQTAVNTIWSHMGYLGTAPTVDWTPTENPRNFDAQGRGLWWFVNFILSHIQSYLCLDPVAAQFSIQTIGSTQDGLSAALNGDVMSKALLYDSAPDELETPAEAPTSYYFFFRRRGQTSVAVGTPTEDYGDQRTRRWHRISKTTGFAAGRNVVPIITNWTADVEVSPAGVETIVNSSELDTLAGELKDRYVEGLNTAGKDQVQHYGGIFTAVMPGCEVHEVVWRDYGDEMGPVTELIRRASYASTYCRATPLPPIETEQIAYTQNAILSAAQLDGALHLAHASMIIPKCDDGSIFIPSMNGTDMRMGLNANTWIYNPTPFEYGSGDFAWLKRSGGTYLIDRAENWRAVAQLTGSISSSGTTVLANPWTVHYDKGNIVSVSTDTITVICPVANRLFRISWQARAEWEWDDYVEQWQWTVGLVVSVPGSTLATLIRSHPRYNDNVTGRNMRVQAAPTGGSDYTYYDSMSGSFVTQLSKNATIKLTSTLDGSGGGSTRTPDVHTLIGDVTIEPLFG